MNATPPIHYSQPFQRARRSGAPLVALESTVITHGLPFPQNLALARQMEAHIREAGAFPATIGLLDGRVIVGLEDGEIARLAESKDAAKVSLRDFARVLRRGGAGGTTVAGTMLIAHKSGIQVFSTGGIGGIHRGNLSDVSADLPMLAGTPMVVVCAGAKAILDLPATSEYLETHGVPVLGYRTDRFPAFYVSDSGLPVSERVETPDDVAAFAEAHWGLGLSSGVLVTVPPPEETALPAEQMETAIAEALADAERQGIRGQAVTPFLLARVSELTSEASLESNLALLQQNARVGAEIARVLAEKNRKLRV